MAEIKKNKVKTKVRSSGTVDPQIDTNLANMAKLAASKPVNGEMDILVKKKDGAITINEFEISDTLGVDYQNIGQTINKIMEASLHDVENGRVVVAFESTTEHEVS